MIRGESGLRADPQFRWWFGDDDLQRQVAALGRKLVCVGGTWVRHLRPGESTDTSPELQAIALPGVAVAVDDHARTSAGASPAPCAAAVRRSAARSVSAADNAAVRTTVTVAPAMGDQDGSHA